jgi:hypothetical protein
MPTPPAINLGITTPTPTFTIVNPEIADVPVEFESLRQHGRIPQVALLLRLVTRTVVITADGFVGGPPSEAEELIHDAISFSDLTEGSDGDQTSFEVLPGRQASFKVRIVNTTGKMSAFVASDPLLGADAELLLSFPGITDDQRFERFKGEILGIILDDFALEIEVGSP